MLPLASSWIHVLVAGALGRIAGAALLRQHAELHAAARAGCRTATAATSGSRRRTTRRSRARPARRACAGSKVSSAADCTNFVPLVVAEAPDVAAALEVVVHRAEIVRARRRSRPARAARRSGSAGARCRPGTGSRRRRRSCTATAPSRCRPRRACCSRSPASSAVLRLQDDRLRVQLLAGAPRRAVHLAASALDAGERVEHRSCCRDPSPSRGRPAPSRSRGSAGCRARATSGTP